MDAQCMGDAIYEKRYQEYSYAVGAAGNAVNLVGDMTQWVNEFIKIVVENKVGINGYVSICGSYIDM